MSCHLAHNFVNHCGVCALTMGGDLISSSSFSALFLSSTENNPEHLALIISMTIFRGRGGIPLSGLAASGKY